MTQSAQKENGSPGATILAVDDEARNVRLLEAQLIPQGYKVLSASNGEQALAVIRRQAVDVVLLDVMMPGMDGFQLTQALRQDPATRLLPIVLITALQETADRVRGIEAGCDDFISKPFNQHEVLARIRALLRLGYYRSQLDDKEKFEKIVEQISECIVVLDGEGRVTRANAAATRLLELGALSGMDAFLGHLQKRFVVKPEGLCRDALAQQRVDFELERPATSANRPLILAIHSLPLRDPLGALSSVVLTARDVTDERREESFKRDFLSAISHKLRTPVTVIQSGATTLADGIAGPLSSDQQEILQGMVKKARELAELIDRLLTFTTIGGGEPPLDRDIIPLREYLSSSVAAVARLRPERTVQSQIEVEPVDLAVEVHRRYADAIFRNLIDNAVKFTPNDPVMLVLKARRLNAAFAQIAIADKGSGIAPEDQKKVFDRFYQVDPEFTGNVEGAGLGLALVKRLVSAYGGAIELKSRLKVGTEVTITLPLPENAL